MLRRNSSKLYDDGKTVWSDDRIFRARDSDDVPDVYDDDEEEFKPLKWTDIMFLPFQRWWQTIILCVVCIKCFFGPLQSALPKMLICEKKQSDIFAMDRPFEQLVALIDMCYLRFGDILYIIDTLLYVMHRQVVDEAMKREYVKKSLVAFALDVLSVVPLKTIFDRKPCEITSMWPKILCFNEMATIYRVAAYFSLSLTHNLLMLTLGYFIMLTLVLNASTCFFVLMTRSGMCGRCRDGYYDWRVFVRKELENSEQPEISLYLITSTYIFELVMSQVESGIIPTTYLGLAFNCLMVMLGYLFFLYILGPKFFCETLLRWKRIFLFHPKVKRIVEEVKERNPYPNAHLDVELFYSVIWAKRKGISVMPALKHVLPRYLRLDIMQDLVWPVFHHSPTFRNISPACQRWLSGHIDLYFKLPGEKFYAGKGCYSHLYYLESGVIELISVDDASSALLSLSGGTLLGEVSFFVPMTEKQVIVRCLTYCEVFSLSRGAILTALHLFPEDRALVMKLVQNKLKHARDLQRCKASKGADDRVHEEGVQWLKRRWWELYNAFKHIKHNASEFKIRCDISPEAENYHCPKYIGQLVLATTSKSKKSPEFIRLKFPWILNPNSKIVMTWKWIVLVTAYIVTVVYPPNVVRNFIEPVSWFDKFCNTIDLIYIIDIIISLVTAIETAERLETSITRILFLRLHKIPFIFDLLSTSVTATILVYMYGSEYKVMFSLNRLLKTHRIYTHESPWNRKSSPKKRIYRHICMSFFCFIYFSIYVYYLLTISTPFGDLITHRYFFGRICLNNTELEQCESATKDYGIYSVPLEFLLELLIGTTPFETISDRLLVFLYLLIMVFFSILKFKLVVAIFLSSLQSMKYQFFVTTLNKHLLNLKIHPHLLRRMNNYLDCHWMFYRGADILYPDQLKNEPFDIHWKQYGELSVKVIGESRAFVGANRTMIKELAAASSFLMLPQRSTLIMFGSQADKVIWIVKGVVTCEYYSDEKELITKVCPNGELMATFSVLLARASIRTCTAASDIEILYIQLQQFSNILKRYPDEWQVLKNTMMTVQPRFDELLIRHLRKHRKVIMEPYTCRLIFKKTFSFDFEKYQKQLRERVFYSFPVIKPTKKADEEKEFIKPTKGLEGFISNLVIPEYVQEYFWIPESRLSFHLCTLQAVVVFLNLCLTFVGDMIRIGSLVEIIMYPLMTIFHVILLICFIAKFFLPYYDERGLIITDRTMTALNYFTRGFTCDILGVLSTYTIVSSMVFSIGDRQNNWFWFHIEYPAFLHLYFLFGYFNYLADKPSANIITIMLLKWYVVLIPIALAATMCLFLACVEIDNMSAKSLEEYTSLFNATLNAQCWLPNYFGYEKNIQLTPVQLATIALSALDVVTDVFLHISIGAYNFYHISLHMFMLVVVWGLMMLCWYITCYFLALLMLRFRGDALFKHQMQQMRIFLLEERISKKLVVKAYDYFSYKWNRTSGVNMNILMNERIGAIFREDLNYYFYKKTLQATDTLLRGGEVLRRRLASCLLEQYYLAEDDITREMDLVAQIYIVHRGKVNVYHKEKLVAILTKGSIFGQLEGKRMRPIRITTRATSNVDLLALSVQEFQQLINEDVRITISMKPTSKMDYLAVKNVIKENPYNTIEYILRGRTAIQLPLMKEPVKASVSIAYRRWLLLVWVMLPMTTTFVEMGMATIPHHIHHDHTISYALDLIFVINFLLEIFLVELEVRNDECVYSYHFVKKLKNWRLYVNIVSVVIPILEDILDLSHLLALARILRMHTVFLYQKQFCSHFQLRTTSAVIKVAMFILLIHVLTCCWVLLACRTSQKEAMYDRYPVPMFKLKESAFNETDPDLWTYPYNRTDCGCATVLRPEWGVNKTVSFMVPTKWYADYLVALSYVVALLTGINFTVTLPMTIPEILYKILCCHALFCLSVWISSEMTNVVYTSNRQMYRYDYDMLTLFKYLQQNGVAEYLREAIYKYKKQIWVRTNGQRIPELIRQAPQCLQEDIMSALYMHHLLNPNVFKDVPSYFLRQLVVRMQRRVLFPGNRIVEEGEINPRIYFIHEGEIEKWYSDKYGELRMTSVLSTCGYFGVIPGLISNTPFQFSYYTRTVVDLLYLQYDRWKDLLDAYPGIKAKIYASVTKHSKDELLRHRWEKLR